MTRGADNLLREGLDENALGDARLYGRYPKDDEVLDLRFDDLRVR